MIKCHLTIENNMKYYASQIEYNKKMIYFCSTSAQIKYYTGLIENYQYNLDLLKKEYPEYAI